MTSAKESPLVLTPQYSIDITLQENIDSILVGYLFLARQFGEFTILKRTFT